MIYKRIVTTTFQKVVRMLLESNSKSVKFAQEIVLMNQLIDGGYEAET